MLTFSDGETIETTGEHPFYVAGEGFVPAGRLAIGNAIVTRAGPVTRLVKAVWNTAPKTVYNFTVEGDHTYFVGNKDGGLWVHNVCVYRALNEAGQVIYVGIANVFDRRAAQHTGRFVSRLGLRTINGSSFRGQRLEPAAFSRRQRV